MGKWGTRARRLWAARRFTLLIYTKDVDATVAGAIKAGFQALRPVEDQFWGDRIGASPIPSAVSGSLATHVEDVSPEEMKSRMEAMAGAPK